LVGRAPPLEDNIDRSFKRLSFATKLRSIVLAILVLSANLLISV
jgi:hypothetical protein